VPSISKAQRTVMAIAEHHPEQLYARNKGLLKMPHQQLHDFAATKESDLPEHTVPPKQKYGYRRLRVKKRRKRSDGWNDA